VGTLRISATVEAYHCVSIQLVSPASGEKKENKDQFEQLLIVSIQLVSPASGEWNYQKPNICL
jgi:hypothetical protein